jgi:hypothetical protein
MESRLQIFVVRPVETFLSYQMCVKELFAMQRDVALFALELIISVSKTFKPALLLSASNCVLQILNNLFSPRSWLVSVKGLWLWAQRFMMPLLVVT